MSPRLNRAGIFRVVSNRASMDVTLRPNRASEAMIMGPACWARSVTRAMVPHKRTSPVPVGERKSDSSSSLLTTNRPVEDATRDRNQADKGPDNATAMILKRISNDKKRPKAPRKSRSASRRIRVLDRP